VKWFDNAGNNRQLYHNGSGGGDTGLTVLTIFPPQGTGVGNRIGDRILAKQIDVKLWLSNKSDRSNVMYRVFAAILPGKVDGNTSALTDIVTGANLMMSFPQSDRVTIIYDHIVNPDMQGSTIYPGVYTGKERSYYHSFTIPLFESMSCNTNNVCDTSNIGLYVVAYDAFGSLASDNIASCAFQTRLWFTDS